MLESVQRRWTKQEDRLFNLSYADRLRALNLFSVRGKLLCTDLIKYWKILSCETSANDLSVLFQRCRDERTRGHRFRLVRPFCNTARQRCFNIRHIRLWNSLPPEVVESASLVALKSSLAAFLGERLYEY